jgi:hypothetical protein
MARANDNSQDERPKIPVLGIITIISVVVLTVTVLAPILNREKNGRHHNVLRCTRNLHHLSLALKAYADDNDRRYPAPDKWCDLIKEYGAEAFVCPAKKHTGQRCSYAINPNAYLYSRADTVLLFETEGGWNQFGGPELLTTENHKPRGCSVLNANLVVRFVKTEELGRLMWKGDPNDK